MEMVLNNGFKSANAIFGKGNIYFSDYLLDNMTEEEIEAIYFQKAGI